MKLFPMSLLRTLSAAFLATATLVSASATPSLWTRLMLSLDRSDSSRAPRLGNSGEVPRRVYPTLDLSREVMGVNRIASSPDMIPFTGKGVTIAVIDGGIDPTHLAFSQGGEAGTSRVVRYLRTTSAIESESGELEVTHYADPFLIPAEEIDRACGGHGTHTSGIAGGADGAGPYSGVAPEADLFLVSLGGALYDDEIACGMTSALEYAETTGSPMVLNFSLGSTVGSHTGNNPLTEILRDYPREGRIAMFAAGNDGTNLLSLTRDFAAEPGELATAFAKRNEGTAAPSHYTEIYSADSRTFDIALAVVCQQGKYEEVWRSEFITPEDFDESGLYTALADSDSLMPEIGDYLDGVVLLARETDPDTPYAVAMLAQFQDIILESPYTLAMVLRSREGADILATTDYSQAYFRAYGLPEYTSGNPSQSISDYCTSPLVVSVGAWNTRESWTDTYGHIHLLDSNFYGAPDEVATYSSYGCTRTPDHARLPHMLAPGTEVISALPASCTDAPAWVSPGGDVWTAMSGTSMATPAAAGVVALWLEACPTLTRDDVLDVIAATARHDSHTTSAPGGSAFGKLDAYEGLRYILHTLSIPGTRVPEPKASLMVRRLGAGEVECSMPFPVTEGTISLYTAQGACLSTLPLSDGSARLSLPSGVSILRAESPQGTATARIIIP